MTKLQEIIRKLEADQSVIYIGTHTWPDRRRVLDDTGMTVFIDPRVHLFVAPNQGIYDVDELDVFQRGLVPKINIDVEQLNRNERRHNSLCGVVDLIGSYARPRELNDVEGHRIDIGYLEFKEQVGETTMLDERVFYDADVSLPKDLEEDVKRGQRSCPSVKIQETRTEEGHRRVTFTHKVPIIRTIHVKVFPDSDIAREAREWKLGVRDLKYNGCNYNCISYTDMLMSRAKNVQKRMVGIK